MTRQDITTTRQTVAAHLATIGVLLPARLIEVKRGNVSCVYLGAANDHRADDVADLLGGTVKGYPNARRVEVAR